jgi:hypothetical protein
VAFLFSGDVLKPEDFRTPAWKRLSQVLAERIEDLRQSNDQLSLSVERTAAIRGGIAELKKILALADEASASPAVDPDELISVGTPGQQ